jgi:Ca2+-binding EF-hand superfamily protein
MRFDFTDKQLQLLVAATNSADGNDVLYHDFLRAVTSELSDYRRKTVSNIFEKLDRDFKSYLVTDQLYSKSE